MDQKKNHDPFNVPIQKKEKPVLQLMIGGALLGSLFTPIAGPLIGAALGGLIGRNMDDNTETRAKIGASYKRPNHD